MDGEMWLEPKLRARDFIEPRGCARPGDDGVAAKQDRGVLDEDRVGIVRKFGQANDLEPSLARVPLRKPNAGPLRDRRSIGCRSR